MVQMFLGLLEIPHGTTDVASSAVPQAFTALANAVGAGTSTADAFIRQENCEDLLHLPRPCDPCIDWPWIPIACFTRDGDNVTPPDCRVRRGIYSLQELEAIIVRIFCFLIHR
ncbi:MAG: hypothetical protein JO165_06630 [Candidatus Eremiobacteraeota bacterium]|nr:hypothetical protein [Candidatus Eremiobacteraeota bacterium]